MKSNGTKLILLMAFICLCTACHKADAPMPPEDPPQTAKERELEETMAAWREAKEELTDIKDQVSEYNKAGQHVEDALDAPIMIEDLDIAMVVQKKDEMQFSYTNNSDFPIFQLGLRIVDSEGKEIYLSAEDFAMPGETAPLADIYIKGVFPDKPFPHEKISLDYQALIHGVEYLIIYDYESDTYTYSH